jgi:hypothetical protein
MRREDLDAEVGSTNGRNTNLEEIRDNSYSLKFE